MKVDGRFSKFIVKKKKKNIKGKMMEILTLNNLF